MEKGNSEFNLSTVFVIILALSAIIYVFVNSNKMQKNIDSLKDEISKTKHTEVYIDSLRSKIYELELENRKLINLKK